MRFPWITLLLGLLGCGPDQLTANPGGPVPLSFVLTPAVAAVDTGSTLQFVLQLTWTDGGTHVAAVTYSATGGTISETGLYQAGTTPGTFLVIASCACALADTASVTIPSTTAAPDFAGLTVSVTGLPVGALADVLVSGPKDFSRTLTIATTLDSLTPGDYQVRASSVTVGTTSYGASAISQGITLVAGRGDTLRVEYQRAGATGPRAHPRVWMTPERITRLQGQVAAKSPRWLRVQLGADAQVAKGATYSSGDESLLPDLCLAYLGTGVASYAQRAGVVLSGYAAIPKGEPPLKVFWYDARYTLPIMSQGLDWCYQGLTVAQRQTAAKWLMDVSDMIWSESDASRVGQWAVDDVPDNNFWWGYMMTGPAALAAAGDDPGIGALSGANRPAFHQQLALRKWTTVALPFFNGVGKGGAWSDGSNYESTWPLGRFVDAFATNGIALDTTFLAASLRWRIASTMPGYIYKVPFGDQPREADAPIYSYDRMAALYAVSAVPGMAGQIQTWLDAVGQVPQNEFNYTSMLADELLRYDPGVVATPIVQPNHFWASGPEYFLYRQSWTDPATTVFAFESGRDKPSHAAKNANGMMIWKGSFWVSATANIFAYGGISGQTQYYNNMIVGQVTAVERDGPGQFLYAGNGGTMDPPVVSDGLVVVRGQAKDAYGYKTPWVDTRSVDDFQRTVAYLPVEDAFVIVDRVTIKDATTTKTFYWQSKNMPVVAGKGFTLASPSGDARCVGSVLAPGDVTLGIESFTMSRTPGAVTSNAVTVTTPARANDVVVTVLQCAMGAPLTPTATVNASEVKVTLGGRLITVPLNEAQAVRIQ